MKNDQINKIWASQLNRAGKRPTSEHSCWGFHYTCGRRNIIEQRPLDSQCVSPVEKERNRRWEKVRGTQQECKLHHYLCDFLARMGSKRTGQLDLHLFKKKKLGEKLAWIWFLSRQLNMYENQLVLIRRYQFSYDRLISATEIGLPINGSGSTVLHNVQCVSFKEFRW